MNYTRSTGTSFKNSDWAPTPTARSNAGEAAWLIQDAPTEQLTPNTHLHTFSPLRGKSPVGHPGCSRRESNPGGQAALRLALPTELCSVPRMCSFMRLNFGPSLLETLGPPLIMRWIQNSINTLVFIQIDIKEWFHCPSIAKKLHHTSSVRTGATNPVNTSL